MLPVLLGTCRGFEEGRERPRTNGATVTAADAASTVAKPVLSPRVVLSPKGKPSLNVSVEIARTEGERQRGLMYRQHLPMDRGMLFLFEEEEIQSFWMKNTVIPLDMIFIRQDMTVAGVVENAEPLSRDARSVDVPSRFVLEVNGGWAGNHGVTRGTPVKFEGIEP